MKLSARQRAGLALAKVLPWAVSWKLLKIPSGRVSARECGRIITEGKEDLGAAIPLREGWSGGIIGSEVFVFRHGYSTHWGANLTARGELIVDLSRQGIGQEKDHFCFGKPRLKSARRIRGSVATLTIEHRSNYFHYLSDAISRLQLIQNLKRAPDYIYVPAHHDYELEILTRLGYRREQIIVSGAHPYIQADELWVPSYVSDFSAFTRNSISFLRSRLMPDAAGPTGSPGRIVYISRKDSDRRQMSREDELLERLARFQVESVQLSKLSVDEQIKLFSSADAVITITGAGLANLIFARPGLLLILITPPAGFASTALEVVKPFDIKLCHIAVSEYPDGADWYRHPLSLTEGEIETIERALAGLKDHRQFLSNARVAP